jgi:hypothetical protein
MEIRRRQTVGALGEIGSRNVYAGKKHRLSLIGPKGERFGPVLWGENIFFLATDANRD